MSHAKLVSVRNPLLRGPRIPKLRRRTESFVLATPPRLFPYSSAGMFGLLNQGRAAIGARLAEAVADRVVDPLGEKNARRSVNDGSQSHGEIPMVVGRATETFGQARLNDVE